MQLQRLSARPWPPLAQAQHCTARAGLQMREQRPAAALRVWREGRQKASSSVTPSQRCSACGMARSVRRGHSGAHQRLRCSGDIRLAARQAPVLSFDRYTHL